MDINDIKNETGMYINIDEEGHPKRICNQYNDKERAMEKYNRHISTSKIWLALTGLIFTITLIVCITLINTNANILDTAVMVTAITVTGAIFGSNLVWYSKKAASENHYKLRMSIYEDVVNQRLYFVEEMLKLRARYGVDDEVIDDINNRGEIDEFMDDAISNLSGKLDQDQSDYEAPNEIQQFTI